MSDPTPIDVINFALQHAPERLVFRDFGHRVKGLKKARVRGVARGGCAHRPSGEEELVASLGCDCGKQHARKERCSRCNQMVPYHDFPGRPCEVMHVTVELNKQDGGGLQGPDAERDAYYLFIVPREVHDRAKQHLGSGIVLPPGSRL